MRDVKRRVSLLNRAVDDIDAVLVDESGVRALPGRDAAAAATQRDERVLDPKRAEAVEKVGLSGDVAVRHVGVAELADVYLVQVLGLWCM